MILINERFHNRTAKSIRAVIHTLKGDSSSQLFIQFRSSLDSRRLTAKLDIEDALHLRWEIDEYLAQAHIQKELIVGTDFDNSFDTLAPDWVQRMTGEAAQHQLNGFIFKGTGWYLTKSDSALVLPTAVPELYSFCVWNRPDAHRLVQRAALYDIHTRP